MKIVFISKSSGKSRSLTLGVTAIFVFCVVVLLLGLGIFRAGNLYTFNVGRSSLESLYEQIEPVWRQEFTIQQEMLDREKENAKKNLDALATRVSNLQAHIMRIDALGSRLADMAELNEIDFDIDEVPGVGGPKKPSTLQGSMSVSNFISALEELNFKIKDRAEKLSAMESMLIDRTLRSQTLPVGKPTIGGWISSLFGMRTDPVNGKMEFHEGIDYAGKLGTSILAVASGIVTWSADRYGYGNLVEINHGNGYKTRYAHNQKNLVSVGQKVERGEIIALMGSSGRSTGSHVHFEVLHNDITVNPKSINSLN